MIPLQKNNPAKVDIKLGRLIEINGEEHGIKADPIILSSKDMIAF
ncbi:MAG TPA: hypothetical protein PKC21_08330 [Oligoflexia bacterium]|nr:hypothetical protein [Oligoflexia bacterium]HMR25346.1 hypothetical protein [Oligoflexia bacterium]